MTISDDTFQHWVDIAFTKPSHHWTDEDSSFIYDMPQADQVACLERMLREPDAVFELLSDEEINRGLWDVLGANVDYMRVLVEPPVPWEDRKRVIERIPGFFGKFMTARCDEHLSHLDRQVQGGRPLNSICYMWWDCMPTWGGSADPELNAALLACMERILAIDHAACQENALHGLGHWFGQHPAEVERIIDAYLARNPDLPEGLLNYAKSARCGCVQ